VAAREPVAVLQGAGVVAWEDERTMLCSLAGLERCHAVGVDHVVGR
jgi:hypothetical protein